MLSAYNLSLTMPHGLFQWFKTKRSLVLLLFCCFSGGQRLGFRNSLVRVSGMRKGGRISILTTDKPSWELLQDSVKGTPRRN